MILVTGHFRVSPDKVEALRPQMQAVIEANREEDGCYLFAYGEDVLDPGLIRVVERWRDWESLDAHARSAHVAAWRRAVEAAGIVEREVIAHAASEERRL
ncbi:MAG TPA: putative quinol monooxygenase [Bauldia sp.]|nr:putative quinol monooxygenase [Bauldia sp.]